MLNNPYEQYRSIQVNTAGQGSLVIMLYEGALKNLNLARTSIDRQDIAAAHEYLTKAQQIIRELNRTLNMEAGDIAQKLRSLYLFMLDRLMQANMKKDPAMIDEVAAILRELKSAWDAIILKKTRSGAAPLKGEYGENG